MNGAPVESRTVLVTGTSTGIGRATALHLDRLGFRVIAGARTEADADDLRGHASERLSTVIVEVTDSASIADARRRVEEEVGPRGLGGLVNNAGVGLGGPMELFPMDKLRWLFDVNVFGLVEVTQSFLPALRRGRGRIANVSSIASLFVSPFHGPYSATKYSVNALSDALRLELRPHGVSVSVIITGAVKTPIWEKGRRIGERLEDSYPPEVAELYGSAGRAVGKYFDELGMSGAEPEEAARVITRVFTDRRARTRYFVGREALFHFVMDKVFHGELRDRIVLRSVGLKAWPRSH